MSKVTSNIMSISKVIMIIIFITAADSCSTSSHVQMNKENSAMSYDSVLLDSDGNSYPVKILRDNNLWMTTNLKLNIPDSYCYNNTEDNCARYGRLYTWESAGKACALLGKEWRLPTKDEWQRLAGLYGGIANDSVEIRKRAYQSLLYTGNSQFNAVLGGGRDPDGQYARLEAHGFYWTATNNDDSTAWFANFAKGSQSLYHQNDGEKTRAFSVRCVKNIDTLK